MQMSFCWFCRAAAHLSFQQPINERHASLTEMAKNCEREKLSTAKILKLWTSEKIAVVILKFEQSGFTIE